jgi:hypothetical protein
MSSTSKDTDVCSGAVTHSVLVARDSCVHCGTVQHTTRNETKGAGKVDVKVYSIVV